jgi:phospholipase/carboxylesterase
MRLVLRVAGALAAAAAAAGRGPAFAAMPARDPDDPDTAGRLATRPTPPTIAAAGPSGLLALGLDDRRDALLYVPAGYQPSTPAPLVLGLHGAGGDAHGGLYPLQPFADQAGFLLLAVPSRGPTWDVVRTAFGPDVAFIDQALDRTFSRYAVAAPQIAIAGFSDGASYALSLGLTNGDLFGQVLAFSPGFLAPGQRHGQPRVFVSHGTDDAVLPIDRCSRRIVPLLEDVGYSVTYREFQGPHTVPPEIAEAAVHWWLDDTPAP